LTKEAALEFMKQNKSNDLEVSDLPIEDVKVDGKPRHVYYTAKAIWCDDEEEDFLHIAVITVVSISLRLI
jgi:hypothetical protein